MLFMTEDTITDLKTFLTTLIGQHVGGLRDDMEQRFDEVDRKFEKLESKLNKKIDGLSDSVGEALHNFDSTMSDQLQNHETRITKLEASVV